MAKGSSKGSRATGGQGGGTKLVVGPGTYVKLGKGKTARSAGGKTR